MLTELYSKIKGQVESDVAGVVLDSRQVIPGSIFVAISGLMVDGHDFVESAIDQGAAAIVGTKKFTGLSVPYFRVKNARRTLAELSAAHYDNPARKLTIIGVTGTDGKTTTSNYIYEILRAAGIKAGMISTVNAVIGDHTLDTGFHVTTPEAPDVQRFLSQMVAAGLTHVVLEATSHGLAQYRVAASEFDVAVVTNITHEHLDFHGSYEAYRAAKGRLFSSLLETHQKQRGNYRVAILNYDDRSYTFLKELSKSPIQTIDYGLCSKANIYARSMRTTPKGISFEVRGSTFEFNAHTQLLGNYNISNALAAIAATVSGLGIDPTYARQGIVALKGIPGRMQPLDLGQEFLAIVDFAHTPNALRRALQAVREMVPGNVIAVFGSAGLRDREKRRLMAEISAEEADLTVLTAEDPRTESLDNILAEMSEGAEAKGGKEGTTFWRVSDRGDAIRFALELAQRDDAVVVCGKGHEQSMCFGEIEYPWDDLTALRAALTEYLGIDGPEMPRLPTSNR